MKLTACIFVGFTYTFGFVQATSSNLFHEPLNVMTSRSHMLDRRLELGRVFNYISKNIPQYKDKSLKEIVEAEVRIPSNSDSQYLQLLKETFASTAEDLTKDLQCREIRDQIKITNNDYFDQAVFYSILRAWLKCENSLIANTSIRTKYTAHLKRFLHQIPKLSKDIYKSLAIAEPLTVEPGDEIGYILNLAVAISQAIGLSAEARDSLVKIFNNLPPHILQQLARIVDLKSNDHKRLLVFIMETLLNKGNEDFRRGLYELMGNSTGPAALDLIKELIDLISLYGEEYLRITYDICDQNYITRSYGPDGLNALDAIINSDKLLDKTGSTLDIQAIEESLNNDQSLWKKRLLIGRFLKGKIASGETVKRYLNQTNIYPKFLEFLKHNKVDTIIDGNTPTKGLDKIIEIVEDNGFNDPAFYFRAVFLKLERVKAENEFTTVLTDKTLKYAGQEKVHVPKDAYKVMEVIGANDSVVKSLDKTQLKAVSNIINAAENKVEAAKSAKDLFEAFTTDQCAKVVNNLASETNDFTKSLVEESSAVKQTFETIISEGSAPSAANSIIQSALNAVASQATVSNLDDLVIRQVSDLDSVPNQMSGSGLTPVLNPIDDIAVPHGPIFERTRSLIKKAVERKRLMEKPRRPKERAKDYQTTNLPALSFENFDNVPDNLDAYDLELLFHSPLPDLEVVSLAQPNTEGSAGSSAPSSATTANDQVPRLPISPEESGLSSGLGSTENINSSAISQLFVSKTLSILLGLGGLLMILF